MTTPAIVRSVRIPVDLYEWAKQERVNVNGLLVAALAARRGENNIAERLVELNKRVDQAKAEIARLKAVEEHRRQRAADRIHLRSCMAEAARAMPTLEQRHESDVPMNAIAEIINDRARKGEIIPSYNTNREIGEDVRNMWPSVRATVLAERDAAREAAILQKVKQ